MQQLPAANLTQSPPWAVRVKRPELCVIYNPAAGRGRAEKRLAGLRKTFTGRADFLATCAAGHGEELAFEAVGRGYAIVGAAGGDGTVHEVANGVLKAAKKDISFTVFPIGSANDYAFTLNMSEDWWQRCGACVPSRAVDIGVVSTPEGRKRFFINGLGLGFNGAVTLESRRIPRLQGVLLYSLALLKAAWSHYKFPRMHITTDTFERDLPTLAFSASIGQREGNFVLAPNALVDDGLFDYLHAGRLTRWELLRHVPGMITGKLPMDYPNLWRGRCREVRLHSESPLVVHLDGELFSRPEDEVRDLEIRLLPGALRVWGSKA